MVHSDPLVTVAIATHNRAGYAFHAVKGLLGIKSPLLQVVVHDSSDDGQLPRLIAQFTKDTRLMYRHSDTRLSMTENYNRALALARGDYVCVIGDDDGVSGKIVELAQWAKKHGVKAVVPKLVANYAWPDFITAALGNRHASRLYVRDYTGRCQITGARASFMRALENAGQGTDGLPKLYHGLVRRDVLDSIKKETGNYLHGVSPDVSGSISIAMRVESYVYIDFPFTLPGAAGASNTGRSAMRKHIGPLEGDPHMEPYRNERWPNDVPEFFSVETVWAQAAYRTLEKNGVPPRTCNIPRLYALCVLAHPRYMRQIRRAAGAYMSGKSIAARAGTHTKVLAHCLRCLADKAAHLTQRLSRPTVSGGRFFVEDLETIDQAMKCLDELISTRGINWDRCVTHESRRSARISGN
jgi:hypothetical protein